MTTEQEIGRKHILLVTTADTDILTAERAMSGIAAEGFPQVRAYNPVALETSDSHEELLEAAAGAGVVVLRLLGGKRAMPEAFLSHPSSSLMAGMLIDMVFLAPYNRMLPMK